MNKDLTPLEAWEAIKLLSNNDVFDNRNRLFIVIETALKRLETLEEEKQSFDRQLEKEHKALETIKEKRVNVDGLVYYFKQGVENEQVCHWYNCYQTDYPDEPNRILQIEDVELLKEVLL